MFEAQPVADAAVYLLRFILHNWPDAYCVQILSRLRAVAQPNTRLIVMDQILDYLSRSEATTDLDVPGVSKPMAPPPLLPYPDAVAGYGYGMDMLVRASSSRVNLHINIK